MSELDIEALRRLEAKDAWDFVDIQEVMQRMPSIIAALERAGRLEAALRGLWLSLHETEEGLLFEDFTQERWDQFRAAYEAAQAALAPTPAEEGSGG